jgi:sugar (pentulose or hexulose) kinase
MAATGWLDDPKSYTVETQEVIVPDAEKHRLFEERYQTYLELYNKEASSRA